MSYLKNYDPEVNDLIQKETLRQQNGLELIASENYASKAVMEACGSVLTNKYAEGLPGKRYYDGCEFVDQIETMAIERAKKLFKADFANVQPHSGANANLAAFFATLNPGDSFLGMDLSQGGHLTHGSPVNFSGKVYKAFHYGLDLNTERIDYNIIEDMAKKHNPKMIIAGASAYPRVIDFEKIAQIAKQCNATLLVDMAHIAGLIAAGVHPTPIPHADIVTSTTHKTLRGPRSGIILAKNSEDEKLHKRLNSAVFPGLQGGPLEHVIAGKAVAFKEALSDDFISYQKQVVVNAQALAAELVNQGAELVSGGTDNHLILFKTDSFNLSGKEASILLDNCHITCNKNMVPGDKRSPFVTSGIRLGSAAITTRGFTQEDCKLIGEFIGKVLKNPNDQKIHTEVKNEIHKLCEKHPIYEN
ncbi:serine hydroxymethyltransferase [Bacteriovoracaceae bacterium]|nr:serine hydroxymethyltransferase [Bacteriovoracaceae bacterium]